MNTKINCLGFSSSDYPKIKQGMFVELWKGDKGHIETTDGYYSFLHHNKNAFHILDIRYIECDLKQLKD